VKIRKLSQLPIAIPAIDRLLTPKVDWIGLRWVYLFISFCFVGTGIGFIAVQGEKMLDTEFRGGTAIDLRLAEPAPGEHITFEDQPYDGTLTRAQVEAAVSEIVANAEQALAANPNDTDAQTLVNLRNADAVAINPEQDGFTSNWFKIKTTITDQNLVLDAIVDRFAPVIDSKPALEFVGSDATSVEDAPVYPIVDGSLGANIDRPDVKNDVSQYIGGAIVLLRDIQPPVSEKALRDRIDYIRNQGAYITATSRRHMEMVVIDGTADHVTTAAIVVKDPRVNALYDMDQWKVTLAKSEWQIVEDGLAKPTTLAGVQSFSPEIAATFRGKAIVSVLLSFLLITLYIWARFGSIRFSAAAVAPLVHDVITAIGLIALAEILYDHVPGAAAIGIKPFKIDLGLIAAILTIIGYSLNDTIVILDRIRENRGKLAYASKEVINRSVNETFSRSVITSGTTLVALCVMFVIGGEGIASFTYALICGIIVGTYSSIAIAAPLVWTRKIPKAAEPFHRHAEAESDHSNRYENPDPVKT
jgi:SecD/SecF fusion protein